MKQFYLENLRDKNKLIQKNTTKWVYPTRLDPKQVKILNL